MAEAENPTAVPTSAAAGRRVPRVGWWRRLIARLMIITTPSRLRWNPPNGKSRTASLHRLDKVLAGARRRAVAEGTASVCLRHFLPAIFESPDIAPFAKGQMAKLEVACEAGRGLDIGTSSWGLERRVDALLQATTDRSETIAAFHVLMQIIYDPTDWPEFVAIRDMNLDLVPMMLREQWQGEEPTSTETPDAGSFEVVVHNDDYTTKVFVVELLVNLFGLDKETAESAMVRIHEFGDAAFGPYPLDEARRLVGEIVGRARAARMPLMATFGPWRQEPEEEENGA